MTHGHGQGKVMAGERGGRGWVEVGKGEKSGYNCNNGNNKDKDINLKKTFKGV